LREENLDALVLAEAGLERLGLTEAITERLDPGWMLPAVGQGALGLECRADDAAMIALVSAIDDRASHLAVKAERALLRGLGGGCQVPIGAVTTVAAEVLTLRGAVIRPDGGRRVEGQVAGPLTAAESLGRNLAEELMERGAREFLALQQHL
jgi:hydroxymethylbilane synthase